MKLAIKAAPIVVLILSTCVAAFLYVSCKPIWQFDHLEKNARRVITASELQTWATNLLAQYHTNIHLSFTLSELGTNFPQQLRGLAPELGPHIEVYQWEETYPEPSVRIWWGSGFLGAAGFEMGPTNFVLGSGNQWQPGVYFFRF